MLVSAGTTHTLSLIPTIDSKRSSAPACRPQPATVLTIAPTLTGNGWVELQSRMKEGLVAKTVAIIGASADRRKYGNKAVRAFRDAGWRVLPIHPSLAEVEGIAAYPDLDAVPIQELDRVSLYVPPGIGIQVLDQVARKKVGEVWLNPGSESAELRTRADELGLNVIQACSIFGAGRNPASY
jgi:predicted CoA-binding protein